MAEVDFGALLNTPAELCDELKPYVERGSFPVLRHPILYAVPYFDSMNAYLNVAFEHRKLAVKAALQAKQYIKYIWHFERPYRLRAFFDIKDMLSSEEYWSICRTVYQDSENVEELTEDWRTVLTSQKSDRLGFMEDYEAEFLRNLPDVVIAWRGAQDEEEMTAGFSWSLSESVARWFSKRNSRHSGLLAKASVPKDKIIAYLHTREEEEVIFMFEDANLISMKKT